MPIDPTALALMIAQMRLLYDSTWDNLIPYPVWEEPVVTFSFPDSLPGAWDPYDDGDPLTPGFFAFNEEQREASRQALELWSDVSGLTFNEVDGSDGDIRLFMHGELGDAAAIGRPPGEGTGGDIRMDPFEISTYQVGVNGGGFHTLVHEIGHAIGLGHPGFYDANAPGNPPTYAENAMFAEDTLQYSILSYFEAWNSGADHTIDDGTSKGRYISPQTPMIMDIEAIKAQYPGLVTSTRMGDTVYGFGSTANRDVFDFTVNIHPVVTLYDDGGNDTLSLSGAQNTVRIDLNPGEFSDYGQMTKNISIAFGTIIENAYGGAGNDVIIGNDVDNNLFGGAGDDEISGREGNDTISGGGGDDTAYGGKGDDIIVGETGVDTLHGEQGEDEIYGGDDDDILFGGDDDDVIYGEQGNDKIFGERGDDTMFGGAGDDEFWGGEGANTYWGGKGSDTVTLHPLQDGSTEPAAWVVNLQTSSEAGTALSNGKLEWLYEIENVITADLDDIIFGNSSDNMLSGLGGADFISALDGDDTVLGGGGDDVLQGGSGINTLDGGKGVDEANYAWAAKGVTVGLHSGIQHTGVSIDELIEIENLSGSIYDDYLTGDDGNNILNGDKGDDTLIGGDGNDELNGGDGDDDFNGGEGNDTFNGEDGSDTVRFNNAAQSITVRLDLIAGAQQDTGQGLDILNGIENILGSFYNDTIVGNGQANVLDGLNGVDWLFAGAGNDEIHGGVGEDFMFGQEGDDHLFGGAHADRMFGGLGNDTFHFADGDGNDVIFDFEDGIDLLDLQELTGGHQHKRPDNRYDTGRPRSHQLRQC